MGLLVVLLVVGRVGEGEPAKLSQVLLDVMRPTGRVEEQIVKRLQRIGLLLGYCVLWDRRESKRRNDEDSMNVIGGSRRSRITSRSFSLPPPPPPPPAPLFPTLLSRSLFSFLSHTRTQCTHSYSRTSVAITHEGDLAQLGSSSFRHFESFLRLATGEGQTFDLLSLSLSIL